MGEGERVDSFPSQPTLSITHPSIYSLPCLSLVYFLSLDDQRMRQIEGKDDWMDGLPFLVFNVGKGTVYRQVLSDKEKVGKGNECERRMMRANPFLPSPLLFSFPPFKRVGRKCMGKRMRVTWLALSRPFSSICLFFLYLFFILKSFPPVVKANKRSLFIST